METLWQDLRYGLRMFARKPGFTVVAVMTLALGIGANTAIFSVVNAVMLQPLPYQKPEDLMLVRHIDKTKGTKSESVGYADFQDWKAQNRVFEDLATFRQRSFALAVGNDLEQVSAAAVSSNFFQLLGVKPFKGRTFLPEEEKRESEKVVLVSYALWKRVFGGDEELIGRQVKLSNQLFTVVGVMAPDFKFPFRTEGAEIWATNAILSAGMMDYRGARNVQVVARLKPGVSWQAAQTEMTGIAGRLEQENPVTNRDLGVLLVGVQDELTREVRTALWVLFGAVTFVMLIACANVANLLLARAVSRHKEMAIRAALGASAWHIVRQLLTESLLLSLTGGAVGLLLASWGIDLLLALSPQNLPRINAIGINGPVLGFTFIISMITGVFFGLLPALKAAQPDLNEALKSGSKASASGVGRNWLRSALIVGELALAVILLTGAGLLINSFIRLNRVELGFTPENVLAADLNLSPNNYPKGENRVAFLQLLQEQVKGLPGVRSVSFTSTLPFSGGGIGASFKIKGRDWPANEKMPMAATFTVMPDYFATMGMPLLQGRQFTEADDKSRPGAAIINEAFARQFFANEDPLGQSVTPGANRDKDSPAEFAVVGVTGNIRGAALDKEPQPEIYTPYRQTPWTFGQLVIRTENDALGLANTVRRQIKSLDPGQTVPGVNTVENLIAGSIKPQRFNLLLLSIFAATGLMLAFVGIYGVMSYHVVDSTREIGVRMALGAQTADVLKLVLRQGARLTLFGVVIGLAGAIGLTRLMAGFLYGVKPTDPLTLAGVSVLLVLVAALACYLPARRATKVDPMVALRYE
jgi:putative ABC transport system permease protein